MATTKSAGTASNLRDSNPQYLGVKLSDGAHAQTGSIIVRQRGTKIMAGDNVGTGKDHTLFAKTDGTVRFRQKNRTRFNGKTVKKKFVDVIPA
ncbi:MAG: 50S ribosomal protein L27 [Candidatus Paceibacterota bacterium]